MVSLRSMAAGAGSVAISLLFSTVSATFQQDCAQLPKELKIPNATVWFSEFVAAGTNLSLPDNNATCMQPSQVVGADICRVALYVATSNRSGISLEAWLPRNWTGRFLSTGNGGIAGCIQYADLAYTSGLGFATVGANNGHNGTGGGAFLNNPDVVTDFGWRSVHTGTVVGKQISQAFYNKTHTKSFYLGCSTGGRQGFKSAQAFPGDFDGIVAGSPALRFSYLTSWSGIFYPLIRDAGPTGFPPPSAWPAIDASILAQCDLIDGAADGIIEDPDLCLFRPEALICPKGASNTSTCLTGKQANSIRKLFSDLYGVNGEFIYPHMQIAPGILEAVYAIYGKAQFPYTTDWFKYAVFDNQSFNTNDISPQAWEVAWDKNPGMTNTWQGDLSAFQGKGGKILTYHGQADPIISSTISPLYYDFVSSTMNLPSSSLDEFYRFFRISGMGHCGTGPGATFIGNVGAAVASLDPDENVLMAMVRWVEKGVAPDTITGTKFMNDTASLGVAFKRAHCRYPYRNVYVGPSGGDGWKNPSNWNCTTLN
ncbi:tannase [Cladophialophora chaetospira]|uniref:Carboxylic ester hydrolase n=1 Tax=Cladophialophora chaetospira TaxID=386627 RepID=A0AA38X3S1_9EURO|nr:tannase [Cladophialophora chaetospira]